MEEDRSEPQEGPDGGHEEVASRTVSSTDYWKIVEERPRKFSSEEVYYHPAPPGSALRCGGCFHFYRRATDGFSVCEIFRDDRTDIEGIDPAYRCHFFTVDGSVHPFWEE